MKIKISIFLLFLVSQFNSIGQMSMSQRRAEIARKLGPTLGTYSYPPRLENGDVDMIKLIRQLKDIHANTYHWLDRDSHDNLEDLKKFLPMAKKAKIKV